MGGLGHNKDSKWTEANNKLEKMKRFSKQIGKINSKNMKLRRASPHKVPSKRDRALEFAMRIKKPKIDYKNQPLAIEFENTKERSKLWEGVLDDKKYRLEKEKIKLIYNS